MHRGGETCGLDGRERALAASAGTGERDGLQFRDAEQPDRNDDQRHQDLDQAEASRSAPRTAGC
jgi:hypothetical protein